MRRVAGLVGSSGGSGLSLTTQSVRGGSGCCEEVVREDEDVDDCDGDRGFLVKTVEMALEFGADIW